MISNPVGFLIHAHTQWEQVGDLREISLAPRLLYPILMALGPSIAWYYGSTQVGWAIGDGEVIKLTRESALMLVTALYFAMLTALGVVGYFIHWMAHTYGCESSTIKGIVVAGYTATPLFIAGLCGFYPIFWFDLLLGIFALSWSVYLLYVGIPTVMHIPEERGFLYSTAILGICMVIFMGMMGATVILWDMGAAPVFTD